MLTMVYGSAPSSTSVLFAFYPAVLVRGDDWQDFAAEAIQIEGLETDEFELVCIRNVDILAKW